MCAPGQDFGVTIETRIKDDLEDCAAANWNLGEAIKDIDVNGACPRSQWSMTNVDAKPDRTILQDVEGTTWQ